MAVGQLWAGISGGTNNHFQWVPQPDLPVPVRRVGYFEQMTFEGGGTAVARSHAYHREFDFNVAVNYASGLEGLEAYADFAGGLYGDGLFYFADPHWYQQNLFPPHWASPGLCEQGWPALVSGDSVSWADTAANSYSQPRRTPTWDVTTDANATPLTDSSIPFVIIPVPPGLKLRLGISGTATGTAVVRVETWAADATSAGVTLSATLLDPTADVRLNTSVSTWAFAKIYVSRTSSAASTISLTSMMAQLWPIAVTPDLTGSHIPGRGHTGLRFADSAAAEDYHGVHGGEPLRGLSTRLVEVGAWLT